MRFLVAGMMVIVALAMVVYRAQAEPGQPPQGRPSQTSVLPAAPGEQSNRSLGNVGTDGAGIIAMSAPLNDKIQQITVIDTRDRVMAVYHVDANGVIELKNVRKIHWDLQMVQFNGT